MPPSGNISELRRVVGMIKYLVRFIPDLVTVISPMKDMFKASNMLMWSHKQDESSTRLKLLTSAQLTNQSLSVFTLSVMDLEQLSF